MMHLFYEIKKIDRHTPNPSQEGKFGADLSIAGKVANFASPLERG